MVQRLLAARSERESKAALLASGLIVFVQFWLFLLIGVMLFVFAQSALLPVLQGDPDRILPAFIVREMPVGLAGIALAGIFAIAMSNASGSLNSLASSTVIDLGRVLLGKADESHTLRRPRSITLVWGLTLGMLGLIPWRGGVFVAGLTIASITYGELLGVFLLGIWNPRANESGALAGFLTGIAAMIVVAAFTPLAFTWYVTVGTFVNFLIGSLTSLAFPAPARPQS